MWSGWRSASLCCCFCSVSALHGIADWVAPLCFALVPFSGLFLIREHCRRLNLATLRSRQLLLVDLPVVALQFLFVGLLAWSGQLTSVTAFLAIAVASLPALVWLFLRRHEFVIHKSQVRLHFLHNLKFGRWLFFMSLAWVVGDSSFRWLVGSLHGLAELGRLTAALMVVTFTNPVLMTLQNYSRAIAAREYQSGGSAELVRLARRGTIQVTLIGAPLFAVLACVAGPLIDVVFDKGFDGLGGVAAVLCAGVWTRMLIVPVESSLVALAEGKAMLIASFVRLGLILAVGVPCIVAFGLFGVGIGMAASCIGSAAVQWYVLMKASRNNA